MDFLHEHVSPDDRPQVLGRVKRFESSRSQYQNRHRLKLDSETDPGAQLSGWMRLELQFQLGQHLSGELERMVVVDG